METAAAVSRETGIGVEIDDRLRERGYGEWEGLTSVEIKAEYPEAWARWRAGEEPGVAGIETRDVNGQHVAEAIEEYAKEAESEAGSRLCCLLATDLHWLMALWCSWGKIHQHGTCFKGWKIVIGRKLCHVQALFLRGESNRGIGKMTICAMSDLFVI